MSKKKNEKKVEDFKILTLGDSSVGKTSFILKFIEDKFSLNYIATIGLDYKHKKINLSSGETVGLRIFDTAGQERFKSIAANYIRKANGILLVYDITDQNSFNNLKNWYDTICEDKNNEMPIVLIGNKSDLNSQRKISKEDGANLAKEFGIENHFYETSCQNGDNVIIAVNDLVQQIYEKFGYKEKNTSNIQINNKDNNKKDNKNKNCCN